MEDHPHSEVFEQLLAQLIPGFSFGPASPAPYLDDIIQPGDLAAALETAQTFGTTHFR
jgi:hypothetical protein